MMNTKLNWGVSSRFIGSRAAEYAARQRGKRERSQMHDFFACEQSRFFRGYIPREARLLDFGCGMGRLLKVLPGREKVGFDVNESALRQCRKAGLRCVGAAELLPKDHFDVALSNHCLEHVPRPLDALKWLSAVMRPGGRLCIMLPLDDWRSRHQRFWSANDRDMHLYTWTPRLLGNLLIEAGFRVDEIRVITSAWHPYIYWTRRLGKHFFRFMCVLVSIFLRRRQLFAMATKTEDADRRRTAGADFC